MSELRNLNELNKGIYKQWIWGSKDNFYRSCDCLQKINYSIQDLNREIDNLENPTMKEVIYVIVLIDWICEAVETIAKILRKGILDNYSYNEDGILKSLKYFKAVRSFVVAHPLSTNRHGKYGFDGDFICVDIRQKKSAIIELASKNTDWFHIDFEGIRGNAKEESADFVLCVYSKKTDGMQFFKYVGVDLQDLYHVAELQIEKLYALDKYLGKLRKKDLGINI